jgi:serine/threonine-protein kinase RsbW
MTGSGAWQRTAAARVRPSGTVIHRPRPVTEGSRAQQMSTTSSAAGASGSLSGTGRDLVVLRLPAAGAYLSVLRTATASLASRLDFTIDDIEDLRIAVDEACAMLLPQAVAGADLECSFELTGDAIDVSVGVLTLTGEEPSRDTFAWTVLTALAGEVDSSVDAENRVTLTLRKRRGDHGSPS